MFISCVRITVRAIVFNATFNNISVLFVEEIGGSGENLLLVTDKLYHIMLH